ncbi:MAG: minor capsid protein [Christensenellaceae bacterium]|jgi:hypothetical protein
MMLQDMAEYLRMQGAASPGEDLFIGALPNSPDGCIALFEYAGWPSSRIAGTAAPGLQVVCRSKADYAGAEQALAEIHRALMRIGYVDYDTDGLTIVNGRIYYLAEPVASGVTPLGEDDNGRIRLARSYYILMEDEQN